MIPMSSINRLKMNYTKHASIRVQQRCIPPLIVNWLLEYGRRERAQGADRITFDKKSRKELARDVGTPVVKQMSRYLNTCIVVDSETETMITAMWIN